MKATYVIVKRIDGYEPCYFGYQNCTFWYDPKKARRFATKSEADRAAKQNGIIDYEIEEINL